MTTVNKTGTEFQVIAQQQEGTKVSEGVSADSQLREAFTYEAGEDVTIQKPLKAQNLDYSGFPKSNRLDASDFASRSINEVKDAAREFNADFPDKPYVVDYSSFPKPEEFDSKTYGGKDKAYTAWKSAVAEWVEDCKQDMVTSKSKHIGSMTEKFESAMNRGFFNMYIQAGMTRDFIQATYEALQGDMTKVKEQLDKKAAEIMRNSRNVGNKVIEEVNTNTNDGIRDVPDYIDDATLVLKHKNCKKKLWKN